MKRIVNLTAVIVGLCIAAASLSFTAPKVVAAVAAAVQVVNTPSNPVPITGAVNATVTGSVDAAVTGNVNAAVTGSVGLVPGTTVNVGNAAGNPVLVRDVDRTMEPAFGNNSCSFDSFGRCIVDLYTVPGDKRVVIEHLSGQFFLPAGQSLSGAQVVHGFPGGSYSAPIEHLVPQLIGNPNGNQLFAANHQTRLYFGPGETIRLQVYKDFGNAVGSSSVSFSGYLTNP
jgi:hypothetical protein